MPELFGALEAGRKIKAGELSVTELVTKQLAALKEREARYHCYITVSEEQALSRAKQVEEELKRGGYADSPLAGVPFAVKDNICTKGVPTTCASKMLATFKPPYDATVMERLSAAGAVLIGKLNMDEFAMGSTTETSFYGPTKNPWNPAHVPGGSSGGAAAAVAAGEACFALGSDTGGSIRQPASFCGVTGIKPTYGTVSRYGLVAYASSLDQIGVLAGNAADCAAVLEVISGADEKDATCIRQTSYRYSASLREGIKGMRIGIPVNYFGEGRNQDVVRAVQNAAGALKDLGAELFEFELPSSEYAVPAYYVLASAEACSNLSRYDGVKYGFRAETYEKLEGLYYNTRSEGFGAEAKRRMLIGAFVLSSGYYEAYYKKALKVRAVIKQDFDRAFAQYDLLLCPTALNTAPKLGTSLANPLEMYLGDRNTVAVNLAGLPAINVPCGFDAAGLPIGMQLIGKPFGEESLFRAAYAYEQAAGAAKRPEGI